LFADALVRFGELGATKEMGLGLAQFAVLAAAQGQAVRAARLFGAAEAVRESLGVALVTADLPAYEQSVASARAGLAPDAFSSAWQEGRDLALAEAVSLALEDRD
jgi:hypothetical protein